MALIAGDEVRDSLFGTATVIRQTQTGYLIALHKPAGIKLDRSLDSLTRPDGSPLNGEAREASGGVERIAAAGAASPGLQARRAIDALRFGVVPESHLEELTIGHHELHGWMVGNLAQPGSPPRAAAVYGPFGSGKSHAMAVIRELARQRGYLTMATEINGTDVSLSQPRELLASLLLHLDQERELDGASPLVALVHSAYASGARTPTGTRAEALAAASSTATRLGQTRGYQDLEPLVERLLGSDPNLSKTDFKNEVRNTLDWSEYVSLVYDPRYEPTLLVAYSPVERRPIDFAQALLGYACLARNAGFQGLVVTVDELEVEAALYTAAKWRRMHAFVAAMEEELGREEALVGGLSLFMAAVGEGTSVEDEIVDIIVDAAGGDRYELRPWDDDDLLTLSERIHRIYSSGYDLDHPYDRRTALAAFKLIDDLDTEDSGRVRSFIRAYVGRLDLQLGPPVA